MATPKIKLTYFNIAAAAEKVRLALSIAEVPFEDERISFQDWGALKPTTPNGQLPIMTIDDGPMLCQSMMMLRYAATFDESLNPPADMIKIETALGYADDFDKTWSPNLYIGMSPTKFGYAEGFNKTEEGQALMKTMRENFAQNQLPKLVETYIRLLKENGDGGFIAGGDKPTIADCVIVPQLRNYLKGHIDHVPVTVFEPFPEIMAYIERFLAYPTVAAYYASQQ